MLLAYSPTARPATEGENCTSDSMVCQAQCLLKQMISYYISLTDSLACLASRALTEISLKPQSYNLVIVVSSLNPYKKWTGGESK